MKILHIIPRYLPAVGGAEIHMAELSQRLAAAGHEVTVATSNALDFEYLWDPNKRKVETKDCLLYTSPSPRDQRGSRMPSSA